MTTAKTCVALTVAVMFVCLFAQLSSVTAYGEGRGGPARGEGRTKSPALKLKMPDGTEKVIRSAEEWEKLRPTYLNVLRKYWQKKEHIDYLRPTVTGDEPVKATVLHEETFVDHVRRTVKIEGRGQSFKSYLLLPRHYRKPAPALLAVYYKGHGDTMAGVSEMKTRSYITRNYGLHLARHGYVALTFCETASTAQTCPERILLAGQAAVDYLRSLPFVDKEKIGAGGQSAGGAWAMSLVGADRRIKLIFSSPGTWRQSRRTFDAIGVSGLTAPGWVLKNAGDDRPKGFSHQLQEKVTPIYALYGKPNRFLVYDSQGHDIHFPYQCWAYRMMANIWCAPFAKEKKLINDLRKGDMEKRILACRDLGRMGCPKACPALLELMKTEDVYLRREAARALFYIGDKSVIPQLQPYLKDSDWLVRHMVEYFTTKGPIPVPAVASAR